MPLQFLMPVTLGLTLISSGIFKFTSSQETKAAIGAFGLPQFLRKTWIAYSLALGELALGAGIVLASGQLLRILAAAATALLVLFSVLVARVLWRKEAIHCNCFGALGQAPVSWPTMVRNLLLVALSLALALGIDGSVGTVAALGAFSSDDFAWMLVVALLAAWIVKEKLPGRNPVPTDILAATPSSAGVLDLSGSPIPAVEFRDAALQVATLQGISRDKAQLLIFARTDCHACAPIVESIPSWRNELGDAVQIRLVSAQSPSVLAAAYPSEEETALHDGSAMGSTILGISGVPGALLLGANGLVGAGPALGSDAVEDLLNAVADAVEAGRPATP